MEANLVKTKISILFILLHFICLSFASNVDSLSLLCPNTTHGEFSRLPIILAFYTGEEINPNINGQYTIEYTDATSNDTIIQVRHGIGTLSPRIQSYDNFQISIRGTNLRKEITKTDNTSFVTLSGILEGAITLYSDSIYHVTGDLTLSNTSSLKIQAGAILLLDPEINIFAKGSVEAIGEPGKPITFMSLQPDKFWGGIIFSDKNQTSQIKHCIFTQAGGNQDYNFGHSNSQPVLMADSIDLVMSHVFLFDNIGKALGGRLGTLSISQSVISRCDTGGEFVNCQLEINSCHILEIPDSDYQYLDDDNDGFYFYGVHPSGQASIIENCYFIHGEDDGIDHNGAKLIVNNCWIEDFQHEGIACSNQNSVEVFNTVIKRCDQGIEAGYGSPEITVNHCVIINNKVGIKFGDNYDWGCSGVLNVRNSIIFGNTDNIHNFDILSGGPVNGALNVSYCLTNDEEYDTNPGCFSGIPIFSDDYYLLPGSPGIGAADDNTNMGLYQENAHVSDIKEFFIVCKPEDFNLIYDHYPENLYVPIVISHNGVTINQARMRIRGDGTRVHPKKSLKVKLDQGSFDDGLKVLNFNAEYEDKSYIQQYVTSRLMNEGGLSCFNVEHARLYLNGQFLGLYALVENMDQDFLIKKGFNPNGNLYKATKDGASLSIYDNVFFHWEKKTGTGGRSDLQALINNINSVDQKEYYNFTQTNFNYSNMINALALNLLTRNNSTYYHNYYLFNDLMQSDQWYIFPWDLDKTFLYYGANNLYHHTSKYWAPDNPILERGILDNTILKDLQIRIDELFNSYLNDQYVSPIVDSLQELLHSSVLQDTTDNINNIEEWNEMILRAKTSFDIRYLNLVDQFSNMAKSFEVVRTRNRYNVGEDIEFRWGSTGDPGGKEISYTLKIGKNKNLDDGTAQTFAQLQDTSYLLSGGLEEGKYYWKVTATNRAYLIEGYNNYNILVVSEEPARIVINEINYHSSPDFDPGDWIELYNNSDQQADISSWVFQDHDNNHRFVFNQKTRINPHSYLILCSEKDKFTTLFPDVKNCYGDLGFNLNNTGELVRISTQYGLVVDSLVYDCKAPWPRQAYGTGSVLELINPNLDNSDYYHWKVSDGYGTPGQINPSYDSIQNPEKYILSLNQNYPNPFSSTTKITYSLSQPARVSIQIFSTSGKIIVETVERQMQAGSHEYTWESNDLPTGIYIFTIKLNGSRIKTLPALKVIGD